jgi:hypothetical protein
MDIPNQWLTIVDLRYPYFTLIYPTPYKKIIAIYFYIQKIPSFLNIFSYTSLFLALAQYFNLLSNEGTKYNEEKNSKKLFMLSLFLLRKYYQ